MRIISANTLSGFARKSAESASDFASVVHNLILDVRDSYRPEVHYMRGPGPKWSAKHKPWFSAHDVGLDSCLSQRIEDADMRPSAGRAAPKCKANSGLCHKAEVPRCLGDNVTSYSSERRHHFLRPPWR